MTDDTKPMRLLNVKVPDWLRELVQDATAVSGAKDMSTWVRDALEAGARTEIAQAQRHTAGATQDDPRIASTHPRATLTGAHGRVLGRVVVARSCTHPPQARFLGVEAETCTLCGAVIRRRL